MLVIGELQTPSLIQGSSVGVDRVRFLSSNVGFWQDYRVPISDLCLGMDSVLTIKLLNKYLICHNYPLIAFLHLIVSALRIAHCEVAILAQTSA